MQSNSHKDEPPTNAKVVLFTSHGQIEIQIWGRQAPLAARNFLQLCMNNYYDNTIFHRMIPGFMIQGGDPTGTGTGGQSIYGTPFRDQFHQRLKFVRRGVVAMANSGKDGNGSQFFITFGECQHLNKKHTIFGRVVGDTIYNFMALQSIDTDGQDRPNCPPVIRRTKVILNPFDDMIAQKPQQNVQQIAPSAIDLVVTKKQQLKKLKKKNKLTFDCDQVTEGNKIKSSHQVLKDSKLSNEVAVSHQELTKKLAQKAEEQQKKRVLKDKIVRGITQEGDNMLAQQQLKKKRKLNELRQTKLQDEVLNYTTSFNQQTQRTQITWESKQKKKEEQKQEQLRQARQKIKQQADSILADELNFKKVKQGSHKQKRKMMLNQQIQLLSNAERIRYEFIKKKEQQKTDVSLFDRLGSFTSKLKAKDSNKNGQWMKHKLKFHIDSQAAYKLDQKKRILHQDQGDLEDGGLKMEIMHTEPLMEEFNIDQLYDMIHGQDKEVIEIKEDKQVIEIKEDKGEK